MKATKKVTSFDDHLDEQYGKMGTELREKFEEDFEVFKMGVLIHNSSLSFNLSD